MSTYKPYGKVKDTPSRAARKHMRQSVFLFNKKASHLRRKTAMLARRQTAQEQAE